MSRSFQQHLPRSIHECKLIRADYHRLSCRSICRIRQGCIHNVVSVLILLLILSLAAHRQHNCDAFQIQPLTSLETKRFVPTFQQSTIPIQRRHSSTTVLTTPEPWEGDDVRWSARVRRRLLRSIYPGQRSLFARDSIIALNVLVFLYQTINTANWLRRRFPDSWSNQPHLILLDILIGRALPGPFTTDFAYSSALGRLQPHRFLTSGFLHGDVSHLILNMYALRRLPAWLETGLGAPLYLTAFLLSIIAGNMGHSSTHYRSFDKFTQGLGASGGICGLYGLMYVSLVRMGNHRAAWSVVKGMVLIFLYGLAVPNISNAAHVGGFLGGLVISYLCAPDYVKSYSLRRKWSLEVDPSPKDYRLVMGFGTKPTSRGILSVSTVWLACILAIVANPSLRAAPRLIWQGLIHPGSVTTLVR